MQNILKLVVYLKFLINLFLNLLSISFNNIFLPRGSDLKILLKTQNKVIKNKIVFLF
ncbi:hypothetical protein M8044_000355 [Columbia Basin potato purple top phytoplasma]|uniref:Uncharacterized protein n=1 Tax=Columbia Basin potato purple top phytoplasma TaxID=307134 RepID=A0ABT5LC18_9MOLU|nr:hypothetical protein [Columbia Basin potato purple top phytoplasma]